MAADDSMLVDVLFTLFGAVSGMAMGYDVVPGIWFGDSSTNTMLQGFYFERLGDGAVTTHEGRLTKSRIRTEFLPFAKSANVIMLVSRSTVGLTGHSHWLPVQSIDDAWAEMVYHLLTFAQNGYATSEEVPPSNSSNSNTNSTNSNANSGTVLDAQILKSIIHGIALYTEKFQLQYTSNSNDDKVLAVTNRDGSCWVKEEELTLENAAAILRDIDASATIRLSVPTRLVSAQMNLSSVLSAAPKFKWATAAEMLLRTRFEPLLVDSNAQAIQNAVAMRGVEALPYAYDPTWQPNDFLEDDLSIAEYLEKKVGSIVIGRMNAENNMITPPLGVPRKRLEQWLKNRKTQMPITIHMANGEKATFTRAGLVRALILSMPLEQRGTEDRFPLVRVFVASEMPDDGQLFDLVPWQPATLDEIDSGTTSNSRNSNINSSANSSEGANAVNAANARNAGNTIHAPQPPPAEDGSGRSWRRSRYQGGGGDHRRVRRTNEKVQLPSGMTRNIHVNARGEKCVRVGGRLDRLGQVVGMSARAKAALAKAVLRTTTLLEVQCSSKKSKSKVGNTSTKQSVAKKQSRKVKKKN